MPARVLFIHGWSVDSTATYGELPARLARDLRLDVQHLHLAKYVSFNDQVRVSDLAFALEAAIQREVKLADGERFAVITHSTGGPIVRTWWERYYHAAGRACPMSHVIHLAAAQFGSALAKMGKGPLSRSKSLLKGIEPGIGVLDWLELGSPESWDLNQLWIRARNISADPAPVFSFCLGGQQIDRKFYDTLNSYTGEMGSDGVVRLAATNLNASSMRLVQRQPTAGQYANKTPSLLELDADGLLEAEPVPFAIVPGVAHSGEKMGIMNAVRDNTKRYPVLPFIRKCLEVADHESYLALRDEFEARNLETMRDERVEIEDRLLLEDRIFLHDACSMVILRVTDDHGKTPDDLRINFTGPNHDPNRLPTGFLLDTQRNHRHPGTFTYFFNHDVMQGCPAIYYTSGSKRKKVRDPLPGIEELGLLIEAFPDQGFARYHPCEARPSVDFLQRAIKPHATILIDVVLKRVIHEGAFGLTSDLEPKNFKAVKPGKEITGGC